jgi:hypothetical protein
MRGAGVQDADAEIPFGPEQWVEDYNGNADRDRLTRGGAGRNFYCTNRTDCRLGFNVIVVPAPIGKMRLCDNDLDSEEEVEEEELWMQTLGEVDDERYAKYLNKIRNA